MEFNEDNIILDRFLEVVHDIEAKPKGALETMRLSFYGPDDECIPEGWEIRPKSPCVVIEVIDEQFTNQEIQVLKPIAWARCSRKCAMVLQKWFKMVKEKSS